MMPPIFLKIVPYLVAAAIGAFAAHRLDVASYTRLQAKFSQYQAEVAQAQEASQKASTEALQGQIKAKEDAETRNAAIMEKIQHENLDLAARATFAQRLLQHAAASAGGATCNHSLPAATDQPAAPDPAAAQRNRRFTEDVGASAAECRDAIERLSALQAELIPQLRTRQ